MTEFTGSVLFLANNQIDYAALTASSEATPVTRLKNSRPKRRWYATGKTSEYVQAAWADEAPIRHVAYVGFNTDAQGQGEVRLSTDATFSAEDSANTGDFFMWEEVYGLGDDPLGDTLGGAPILNSFNDYRALHVVDLGEIYTVPYLRAYLKNPGNANIAQVGFGWLYAGIGFQPDWPHDWGWRWKWPDPSEVSNTESADFIRSRKSRKLLSLSLRELTKVEAYSYADVMLRAVGRKKPMMVVPFPEAPAPERYPTNIYGRMTDDPEIIQTDVDKFEMTVTIKELPQ